VSQTSCWVLNIRFPPSNCSYSYVSCILYCSYKTCL